MSELERRLAGGSSSRTDWQRASAEMVARAEADGLTDLAYERHASPFGTLLVVSSGAGILRIALAAEPEHDVLADLARRASPRIVRSSRPEISTARIQLDAYFEGELTEFDLPLDWRLTAGFRREVLREAAAIPYGSTASYSHLADRAGRPKAVRAAGTAMATNPLPIVIPCHRVLRSDGTVGAYLGGTEMKESLLRMERERTG